MGILHANAPTLHGRDAIDEPVVLTIIGCLEEGEAVVSARRESQARVEELEGSRGDSMVGWGRSGHGIFHEGRWQTGTEYCRPNSFFTPGLWQMSGQLNWSCVIAEHRPVLAGR